MAQVEQRGCQSFYSTTDGASKDPQPLQPNRKMEKRMKRGGSRRQELIPIILGFHAGNVCKELDGALLRSETHPLRWKPSLNMMKL